MESIIHEPLTEVTEHWTADDWQWSKFLNLKLDKGTNSLAHSWCASNEEKREKTTTNSPQDARQYCLLPTLLHWNVSSTTHCDKLHSSRNNFVMHPTPIQLGDVWSITSVRANLTANTSDSSTPTERIWDTYTQVTTTHLGWQRLATFEPHRGDSNLQENGG